MRFATQFKKHLWEISVGIQRETSKDIVEALVFILETALVKMIFFGNGMVANECRNCLSKIYRTL
jgi:hypothetical protein